MHASATASASVHIEGFPGGGQDGELVHESEVIKISAVRIGRLESHISRLSNRLRALEQQQTVLGGIVTLYLGVKVIRWIVRLLLP